MKAAVTGLGPGATAIVAGVTVTADVERAVHAPLERWGRLDVVVNNAGITGPSYPIEKLSDDDWHQVIACDLTSVFLVCRAAIRVMRAAGRGRIVKHCLQVYRLASILVGRLACGCGSYCGLRLAPPSPARRATPRWCLTRRPRPG